MTADPAARAMGWRQACRPEPRHAAPRTSRPALSPLPPPFPPRDTPQKPETDPATPPPPPPPGAPGTRPRRRRPRSAGPHPAGAPPRRCRMRVSSRGLSTCDRGRRAQAVQGTQLGLSGAAPCCPGIPSAFTQCHRHRARGLLIHPGPPFDRRPERTLCVDDEHGVGCAASAACRDRHRVLGGLHLDAPALCGARW